MSFGNLSTNPIIGVITHTIPGQFDPYFMGGLKIGFWGENAGGVLSGFKFPQWMRYFGFWLDFSYHRLNFRRQVGVSFDQAGNSAPNLFFSDGYLPTLAFMFGARYGFFPDSVVPFGRLQPYIAVGPGIFFCNQHPTITIATNGTLGGPFISAPGSKSTVDIGLAVEAGFKWMALKNVSIDVAFKYRWTEPKFDYDFRPSRGFIAPGTMNLNPSYHLLSGQVGVNYHF